MTNPDKYLIAVYDAENNECFLIYKSTISPQLNTQLYFPHLGLYNVEKIVYHISDDRSVPEYDELMFIDVVVSKVEREVSDETVEVLVRIPKKEFEELQNKYVWWGKYGDYIKKGTVLLKGHRKLIAEPTDEEIAKTIGGQNDFAECMREAVKAVFDNAPTIIEADKDGEDNGRGNG